MRHDGENDSENFVPDCIVTFGVDPQAIVARNGYVISEVGKPPDFVLEVASRSTGRRDYTVKREGYAAYGVREYWRIDHTGGEFHDAALAGDTLIGNHYEAMEIHHESDGLIWGHSPILGLDICWDKEQIRLRDPSTGAFIPTPEESARPTRKKPKCGRKLPRRKIDYCASALECLKTDHRKCGMCRITSPKEFSQPCVQYPVFRSNMTRRSRGIIYFKPQHALRRIRDARPVCDAPGGNAHYSVLGYQQRQAFAPSSRHPRVYHERSQRLATCHA